MYAFTCVDNHPNSSGDEYMLPNVHGLLHLADAVQDLGPLWAHSCFPFESLNGNILKLYHGSQGVEKQVPSAVLTLQKLPGLAESSLPIDSPEEHFYNEMTTNSRIKHRTHAERRKAENEAIGHRKMDDEMREVPVALVLFLPPPPPSLILADRWWQGGVTRTGIWLPSLEKSRMESVM